MQNPECLPSQPSTELPPNLLEEVKNTLKKHAPTLLGRFQMVGLRSGLVWAGGCMSTWSCNLRCPWFVPLCLCFGLIAVKLTSAFSLLQGDLWNLRTLSRRLILRNSSDSCTDQKHLYITSKQEKSKCR